MYENEIGEWCVRTRSESDVWDRSRSTISLSDIKYRSRISLCERIGERYRRAISQSHVWERNRSTLRYRAMSESDLSLISDLTLGSCRVRSDLDLGSRYQRRVPLVIPGYPVQSRSRILLSDISDIAIGSRWVRSDFDIGSRYQRARSNLNRD